MQTVAYMPYHLTQTDHSLSQTAMLTPSGAIPGLVKGRRSSLGWGQLLQ